MLLSTKFYSSDLVLVERSILSMEIYVLLISFWIQSEINTGTKKYQSMELMMSQCCSSLYCCLKSASIIYCQISVCFDQWLMCWNCVYHCKMFILVC